MEDIKRGSVGKGPGVKGPANQNNVIDYIGQCELAFVDMYNMYCMGVKENRIPDIIDSFWSDIYKNVLMGDKYGTNKQKSKLVYNNLEMMEDITKLYINLCRRFGGVIKINAFSEFTGISRETLNIWYNAKHLTPYIVTLSKKEITEEKDKIIYINNPTTINNNSNYYLKDLSEDNKLDGQLAFLRLDCKKLLVESMQGSTRNGLSNSPVGHLARANNDEELAMMWDAKRQITSATLNGKTTLTVSELPKLGNITCKGAFQNTKDTE